MLAADKLPSVSEIRLNFLWWMDFWEILMNSKVGILAQLVTNTPHLTEPISKIKFALFNKPAELDEADVQITI